jgi:hypothetical protein
VEPYKNTILLGFTFVPDFRLLDFGKVGINSTFLHAGFAISEQFIEEYDVKFMCHISCTLQVLCWQ